MQEKNQGLFDSIKYFEISFMCIKKKINAKRLTKKLFLPICKTTVSRDV